MKLTCGEAAMVRSLVCRRNFMRTNRLEEGDVDRIGLTGLLCHIQGRRGRDRSSMSGRKGMMNDAHARSLLRYSNRRLRHWARRFSLCTCAHGGR